MEIDEFKRRFGARVQSFRQRRGLTQEQLAEAIGKSTDTVSNIETGRLATRIETVVKLSEVLGVSVAELFSVSEKTQKVDVDHQRAIDQLIKLISPLPTKLVLTVTSLVRVVIDLKDQDS